MDKGRLSAPELLGIKRKWQFEIKENSNLKFPDTAGIPKKIGRLKRKTEKVLVCTIILLEESTCKRVSIIFELTAKVCNLHHKGSYRLHTFTPNGVCASGHVNMSTSINKAL